MKMFITSVFTVLLFVWSAGPSRLYLELFLARVRAGTMRSHPDSVLLRFAGGRLGFNFVILDCVFNPRT